MKGSGDSWEVRTPQQCPSLEAVGKLPKEVYRHWCHLVNDISFLVRNETNVADRIIKALTKTGKLDMASNNSALDTSSVCWSPDMQEREDSQRAPREQWLRAGQDDDQEVQSHRNEGREVLRRSYQQCPMLRTTDKEKLSQRKKASPTDGANQRAQATGRWRRTYKISSTWQWFHFSPRVAWLMTLLWMITN